MKLQVSQRILRTCALLLVLFSASTQAEKVVHPYLTNPGIGLATFHKFNGDLSAEEFPESSVLYFRAYWDEFEPGARGNILINEFDQILDYAAQRGQTVGFRVMADGNGGVRVPDWLLDLGIRGSVYTTRQNRMAYMPDFNDPLFLAEARRLVETVGAYFNGDPRLEFIDIGMIGMTGEWHMGGSDDPLPDDNNWKSVINMHSDSFPNTQLLMPVGSVDDEGHPLSYGVGHGAGWRADCLGDKLYRTGNWNHMDSYYPKRVHTEASVSTAWQQEPVVFETCGDPSDWARGGVTPEQFRDVLNYALEYHASLVNFRSKPIPDQFWEPLTEFLNKVGYQLQPMSHVFPRLLAAGDTLTITSQWENKGVAPPYKPFKLKYRLRNSTGFVAAEWESSQDLKTWLPGPMSFVEQFPVDLSVQPSLYRIDTSIQWEQSPTGQMIKLHSDSRLEDEWVELGTIRINPPVPINE